MSGTDIDLRLQGKIVNSLDAVLDTDVPTFGQMNDIIDGIVVGAIGAHNHDVAYVNVAGDTMSGLLTLNGGLTLGTVTTIDFGADDSFRYVEATNKFIFKADGSDASSIVEAGDVNALGRVDAVTGYYSTSGVVNVGGAITGASLSVSGTASAANATIGTHLLNRNSGDARYELIGVAATGLAAHVAAADPHPVYLTQAEGDARYIIVGGGPVTGDLHLSSTSTYSSLADNTVPLILGTLAAANMVFDQNKIQGRNNNLAADITIQPYGGNVIMAGAQTTFNNAALYRGTFYIETATIPSGNTLPNQIQMDNNPTTKIFSLIPRPDSVSDSANQLTYDYTTTTWAFAGKVQVGAPVNPNDAVRKTDLDSRVNRAGDTMTGHLITITPTLGGHAVNKTYSDAGDSSVASTAATALSTHISSGGHPATAISFDGSLLSPTSLIWHPATITNLQVSNATIIAEIDGRIAAGDVDAIINAINTWTSGDPTLSNSGVFSANVIVTSAIAAGAVVSSKIAANTITASNIAASTITATEIAANTITASKIAANTITATQIAAGTITGTELNATTTITVGTGTYKVKAIGGAGAATYLGITSVATPAYNNANTPFYAGADEQVSIGTKLRYSAGVLTIDGGGTFSGALSAATGTFAGSLSAATGTFSGGITSSSVAITGGTISSSTYSYTSGNYSTAGLEIGLGSSGYIRTKNFALDSSGNAFFKGNGEFAGIISASGGTIGLVDIGAVTGGEGTQGMFVGTGVYNNAATPFYIDDAGDFSLGSKLRYDASTVALLINGDAIINGTLSGSSIIAGTLAGNTIIANTKIKIGTGSTYVTVQGDTDPSNTSVVVADHQDYSFALDATQYLQVAAADTPTITDTFSIVLHVALDSWKTAATQVLASSIDDGVNGGYEFAITSAGHLQIATSTGAALVTTTYSGEDISARFIAKRAYWLRADFYPNSGGNRVAQFYWAESQNEEPGPNDWTLFVLGAATGTSTTIADPTGANGFRIGRRASTSTPLEAPGRYYRSILRRGVGVGSLVFDNTTAATLEASSFPDAANLTPTDDYAIRMKFRVSPPGTWAGTATNITLAGQWTTTSNQRSWKITMDELTGEIAHWVSLDGTAAKTHKVASVFYDQDEVITSDGSVQIAYTLVVGTGTYSSPAMHISYDDGKSWKQGAWFTPAPPISPAAYMLPFNGTSPLYLGDIDDAGGSEAGIGQASGVIYEFDLYTATPFILYGGGFYTTNPYFWYLGNLPSPPSPVLSMRKDTFPTSVVTSFTVNTGQTLTVGTGVVVNPRPDTLIEIGRGDRPATDTSSNFVSTTTQVVTIVSTPDIYTGSYRSSTSPLYSDGAGQFSVGDAMRYDQRSGLSVKGSLTGTGFVLQRLDGSPQVKLVSRAAPNDQNPYFRTYDSLDFPTPTTAISDSSLFWENEYSLNSSGPISRFGIMGGLPKYTTGQVNVAPSVEVLPADHDTKGYTSASLISGGKPLSSGQASVSVTGYGSSLSSGPWSGNGQNRRGRISMGVTGYNASSQYITGFVTFDAGGTDANATAQRSVFNIEAGSARSNGVEMCIVGEIRMYAGSRTGATLPSGWMFCEGQALSSVDYAALYAVIGTKYGSGVDGYYNFSLPTGSGSHIPQGIPSTQNTRVAYINTGNQSADHGHAFNTGNVSADHSHAFAINTGNVSSWHSHSYFSGPSGAKNTSDPNANHYHYAGGNTGGISANHYHSGNTGGVGTNHTHQTPSIQIAYIINVGVATI